MRWPAAPTFFWQQEAPPSSAPSAYKPVTVSASSLAGSDPAPRPPWAQPLHCPPNTPPRRETWRVGRGMLLEYSRWQAECEAATGLSSSSAAPSRPATVPAGTGGARPGALPALLPRPPDVLPPEERAEICEAILQQDPALHGVCRGNMASLLAIRAGCAAQAARERRRRYQEASEANRKVAAEWKLRRVVRDRASPPAELAPVAEPAPAPAAAAAAPLAPRKAITGSRSPLEVNFGGAVRKADSDQKPAQTPPLRADGSSGGGGVGTPHVRLDALRPGPQERTGAGAAVATALGVVPQFREPPPRLPAPDESRSASKKVKEAVAQRLKLRQQHTKKLVQMRRNRSRRIAELPGDELQAQRGAFAMYADDGQKLRPEALLKALMELGLSGRTRHERWSVAKLVVRMCAAIVAEHEMPLEPLYAPRVGPQPTLRDQPPMELSTAVRRGSAISLAARRMSQAVVRPNRRTSGNTGGGGASIAQALDKVVQQQASGPLSADFFNEPVDGRPAAELRVAFDEFCADVVPAVRRHLGHMRQEAHFGEFLRMLERVGSQAPCLTSAEFLSLVELRGLDADAARVALGNVRRGETPGTAASAGGGAGGGGGRPMDRTGTGRLSVGGSARAPSASPSASSSAAEAHRSEEPALDHETVHELLFHLEEHTERQKRRSEHEIRQKIGLDEQVFWKYRHELEMLYDIFQHYDNDADECLSHVEAKLLLKHLGFQPYRQGPEADFVHSLLVEFDQNGDGLVDFHEFLHMMERIRVMQRAARRPRLEAEFGLHACGVPPRLEMRHLKGFIAAIGFAVSAEEQALVEQVVEQFDADASGDLDFGELEELVQRVVEKLQGAAADAVMRFADELGLTMEVFAEYQYVYDQLDSDGSGILSGPALSSLLETQMGRPPTGTELQDLFTYINKTPGTPIEVTDFMRLMHTASSRRMLHRENTGSTVQDVPRIKTSLL